MVRAHALRARTTGNNELTENRALEGREESSHSFGLRRHAAANPGLRASRLTPGYSHRTPPACKMANHPVCAFQAQTPLLIQGLIQEGSYLS